MKRLLIAAMAVAAVALSQRDRVLSQSKPAFPHRLKSGRPTTTIRAGRGFRRSRRSRRPTWVSSKWRGCITCARKRRPPPPAGAGARPPAAPGRGRGRGGSGFSASETTPLVVNGVMYIASPYGRVVALEPTTGKEVWVFQVPAGNPVDAWGRVLAGRREDAGADCLCDGKRTPVFARCEDRHAKSSVRRARQPQPQHAGDSARPARERRAQFAADHVQAPHHHRRPDPGKSAAWSGR